MEGRVRRSMLGEPARCRTSNDLLAVCRDKKISRYYHAARSNIHGRQVGDRSSLLTGLQLAPRLGKRERPMFSHGRGPWWLQVQVQVLV